MKQKAVEGMADVALARCGCTWDYLYLRWAKE